MLDSQNSHLWFLSIIKLDNAAVMNMFLSVFQLTNQVKIKKLHFLGGGGVYN